MLIVYGLVNIRKVQNSYKIGTNRYKILCAYNTYHFSELAALLGRLLGLSINN